VIVGSQVRREEPGRGQVDGSRLEHFEDDGKPPGRAGDFDTVVALAFRQTQAITAVDVERAVALAQVYVARVELGEVSDEVGRRVTLARDEVLHTRNELGVGEASERSENVVLHARVVARASDTLSRSAARGRSFRATRTLIGEAGPERTNVSRRLQARERCSPTRVCRTLSLALRRIAAGKSEGKKIIPPLSVSAKLWSGIRTRRRRGR